jgi:hypothetical protein
MKVIIIVIFIITVDCYGIDHDVDIMIYHVDGNHIMNNDDDGGDIKDECYVI